MTDTPIALEPRTGAELAVHELIREDIITGHLRPNERLKVSDLARRHGVSTSPVREALQMLRGEGFVVMNMNRGARVRPIDEAFIRNIYEVETVIEPYLLRNFMQLVTEEQIVELERIQSEIERNDFADSKRHRDLDFEFHLVTYGRHYNTHALELWQKHRDILGAIGDRYPIALGRRKTVLREHRELLAAIRDQDIDTACTVIARHAEGSGKHTIEQMRTHSDAQAGSPPRIRAATTRA
ncbi:GntR family transcriptional regulator [Fulvimarina sp. 2208YS6-2-32]|uniref:GntR family transcriptional regulator n=1 Tax=Fulvimarina uroteuthidis TaxID=3098149 RepID=A0ABU5I6L5_9HYPH|nr:GntR family transcriptional regulator [Fulvimarina sp. 2208YS6-2-32]MDY8111030.1 GntR family transcriptional regulator [Fulvimarina sp. 2208YS6-2-32]